MTLSRSPPHGRTVLYNPQMQSLVVQTTVGPDSHPMDDTSGASTFMDSNYFRMLADANIALSRRASLQADSIPRFETNSSIGTPTSSGRASLDLERDVENSTGSKDRAHSPHLSHDALNQGYYGRFFVETMKLGRGYRGSVFLCQHILDGIHLGEYAIKKVAVGDNHDWLVQMLREVHLLERLHHPNIVSYKHAWLENHQLHKFGPEVTCLFILMECANGGNLEEYIERATTDLHVPTDGDPVSGDGKDNEKIPISVKERLLRKRRQYLPTSLNQSTPGKNGEGSTGGVQQQDAMTSSQRHHLSITEIWSFFFDICEGLAHLHRLGIIHRDLKPPNLLLSYSSSQVKGSKGERPRVLITDFGECEVLDQAAKRDRTGATGTLEFLAPELLAEDVDILKEEIREFKSITIPEDGPDDRVIPDELKILIRVLLSTDKSKRPSCDDILTTLSHQRDRMMHGDMDSPTTPIRASSATPTFANSESVVKGSDRSEDKCVTEEGSQITSTQAESMLSKNQQGSQLQRPQFYNVHSSAPSIVPGRRRSIRTAIVTDSPRSTSSQTSSTATLSIARNNTASPSVNLHKKVKPLGLGLRHMLRRRMMHPATAGLFAPKKYSSRGGNNGTRNDVPRYSGQELDEDSPPSGISTSSSVPSMGTLVPRYNIPVVQQQANLQHFRSREQAANERELSVLGKAAVRVPATSADEQGSSAGSTPESGVGSMDMDAINEGIAPTRFFDVAMPGDALARNPRTSRRKKKASSDDSGQSADFAKHRRPRSIIKGPSDSSTDDDDSVEDEDDQDARTTTERAIAPLRSNYWTKLAHTHHKEKSRASVGSGEKVQESIDGEEDRDQDGDQNGETTPSRDDDTPFASSAPTTATSGTSTAEAVVAGELNEDQFLRQHSRTTTETTVEDNDDDNENGGGQESDTSSEQGLLVRRMQLGPSSGRELDESMDQKEDMTLFWQAFLSGIVIQLLWIGAVKVFSRGGICAM
ncbi:putative serine/threonine-protein kinase iks1 [Mortierella sp. GBA30]|nr:putative serine/threonine-protein kinase iks1 [Mortierella sp. GBA30]